MMQNPFYKRMQGEAEAVLERHIKKAHHLRNFNNVGGQRVRAPNLDPIPGRKDLTVRGFDPTGAHGLSVLYGSAQIFCDAPKPGGQLTTRQPAEYSWISGYPTPLMKIEQSLLCTGSSTQGTTCPNNQQ